MRVIAVPGIAIQIPVIGFGCSAITSMGDKKALQVLGTAFDAGVRHFDVARYYGYGESEGLLGKFLKSRRAEVTITTKFGIDPPRRTNALRFAMQAGRRLVQLVPAARGFLRSRARGLITGGAFSVNDARTNLETSLRELGTDYIDFYLLHDYVVSGDSPRELVEFLTEAVRAGKIRYFGIGTGFGDVLRALETRPSLCSILQFENSVVNRNVKKLPPGGPQQLIITFGSLSASYHSVSAFLKAHVDVARAWSTQLAADCSRDETISALMLNYSARDEPEWTCAIFFPGRIANGAKCKGCSGTGISPEQVELFGQLVERDLRPPIQSA